MSEEERAPYGYCENCAEPFNKPYTHCPFCNTPNRNLEKQLQNAKSRTELLLEKQMLENRAWADANREEVTAMVDAQHEANLKEMKDKFLHPFRSSGSGTKGQGN